MKLNRTLDGKFCDGAHALWAWVPVLLEGSYHFGSARVITLLERAAYWCQDHAAGQMVRAGECLKPDKQEEIERRWYPTTWSLEIQHLLETRDLLLDTAAKVREIWK